MAIKLKGINKNVKIFLMSAFEFTDKNNSDIKEIELKDFLQKPFHMQQLLSMVEKHIGQKSIRNSPK